MSCGHLSDQLTKTGSDHPGMSSRRYAATPGSSDNLQEVMFI
jgi:hypothetical protein